MIENGTRESRRDQPLSAPSRGVSTPASCRSHITNDRLTINQLTFYPRLQLLSSRHGYYDRKRNLKNLKDQPLSAPSRGVSAVVENNRRKPPCRMLAKLHPRFTTNRVSVSERQRDYTAAGRRREVEFFGGMGYNGME